MLTRKRLLAAKIESTVGTAETLAAGDADMNIFDAVIQPSIDFEERPGQSALSPLAGVPGAQGGQVTLAVELNASGADGAPKPAWAEVFLPACGLINTGTGIYEPSSAGPTDGADDSAVRSITIGVYEDGILKRLAGCMGNMIITLTAGMIAKAAFTFTGKWVTPGDVALLAPNYPSTAPLRFASAGLTIGSWTPILQQMTIDQGNDVQLREDANEGTGYLSAIVTGRRYNGAVNPESVLLASNDPFTTWLNRTEQALALNVGSVAGNTINIDAPKLQFSDVQEGDRNGIKIDDISYQLNRSLDAGDDEFKIEFT